MPKTEKLNKDITKVLNSSSSMSIQEMLELELVKINKEPMVEFADFTQDDTNLPCIVWVDSPRNLKHGLRIKFLNSTSTKDDGSDLIPMTISDNPQIPSRVNAKLKISMADLKKIKQWVILNKDTLTQYAHGDIPTRQLYNLLKPINDSGV